MSDVELVRIPDNILSSYRIDHNDVDVLLLARSFGAPRGSKVLVVGAHDEPTANILTDCGFEVIGMDLRSYDKRLPPCNYTHIQGDFCNLPREFMAEHLSTFDVFVCLSAIEHFGMSAYGEGTIHTYYDVIAMHTAWRLLKDSGVAYVSVPMGSHYLEVWPNWRVYNLETALQRLGQDFRLDQIVTATAADVLIDNRIHKAGQRLYDFERDRYSGIPPHVSSLLVWYKTPTRRIVN